MFWKRRSSNTDISVASKGFAVVSTGATEGAYPHPEVTTAGALGGDSRPGAPQGESTASHPGIRGARSSSTRTGAFVVPAGYRITGSMVVPGTLRVDGELAGRGLFAARMVVSAGGRVQASTEVAEALVEGVLAGPLKVRQQVEIAASARIKADIEAPRCVIQPGAVIEGAALSVGPRR